MKFRLSPSGGSKALQYTDLIARLQNEFPDRVCISDISEPDVEGMVAELIELDSPQQMIDDARTGVRLRVSINDSDFSDDGVVFDITPATHSITGHYPTSDCGTVLQLLRRCSETLGYELELE